MNLLHLVTSWLKTAATWIFGHFFALGVFLVFGVLGRAPAQDAAMAIMRAPFFEFAAPRDPDAFLADLSLNLPRPRVLLTRDDAVAHELVMRSLSLDPTEALQTAQTLCEEARRSHHDPLLFLAVIHIESRFDPLAISPVGAEGLMQLMPATAQGLGGKTPITRGFDPRANVRLGVRYLAQLEKKFGRFEYALTAYNRGPGAMQNALAQGGGVHDVYASKVMKQYDDLRVKYGHLPL